MITAVPRISFVDFLVKIMEHHVLKKGEKSNVQPGLRVGKGSALVEEEAATGESIYIRTKTK